MSHPSSAVPAPRPSAQAPALRVVTTPQPSPSPSPRPNLRLVEAVPEEPDPRLVQAIACGAYEALDGSRPVSQLASWVTERVAEFLLALQTHHRARRRVSGDQRRAVPVPGRVRIMRPEPAIAEASCTLHLPHRSVAVAMRLEHRRGRWRATDLTVL